LQQLVLELENWCLSRWQFLRGDAF